MSKVVSITTFVSAPSLPEQAARRLDPVELRHAHVHQHDMGAQAERLGDCLLSVCGLADDLHALLGVEDHAKAGPDERLVVDDEDADDAAVAS